MKWVGPIGDASMRIPDSLPQCEAYRVFRLQLLVDSWAACTYVQTAAESRVR